MIAADRPVQRPADARLLIIDAAGTLTHAVRARWIDYLRRGDIVVANDAATLPASLSGIHARSGQRVELRLAAWRNDPALDLSLDEPRFDALLFGAGDYHTRTEARALPPPVAPGDALVLGPLTARVVRTLGHPRLLRVQFAERSSAFWQGLAAHGRAIQYAHVPEPIALWDAWTTIASAPAAFEAPSAGFILDWREIATFPARGIGFATLTHAAGLSSTGDEALDARLPLDEWYRIPKRTAAAIDDARSRGGRVIAVGTTVVRALEDAADARGRVRAGTRRARGRIGRATTLRIVGALVTGTHEPGSSHHELLRAFADDGVLETAAVALESRGYRTHEFGDSMLVFSDAREGETARRAPRDTGRSQRACCCCGFRPPRAAAASARASRRTAPG
jgi:S-adenosylmethionine:tRNA ribosyltransferase-isomerase